VVDEIYYITTFYFPRNKELGCESVLTMDEVVSLVFNIFIVCPFTIKYWVEEGVN
jgi:hypothetical protein